MPVTVLIADDHAVVRDGLRAILEGSGLVRVVGVAGSGREVLDQARTLRPQVVLMDIAMPDLNGIEATERLRRALPEVQVVVLSMHATSEHVFRALAAGARGYLVKESAGSEVVAAVQAVAAGRRYLSPGIAEQVVNGYLRGDAARHESPLDRLSERERDVVQHVVEGKSSAEIARLLHLSPKTVDTYRSRAMAKLGVEDLAGLVRFALEHGITPLR